MDEHQNDNQTPELQPVPPASELETKLAEAETKRDEYLSGWQRAKADFVNYKKEEFARLTEVGKYGNEELIRELITTLDNFDLALRAMEQAGPVEKGAYMIRTQMEDVLKRRGLDRITTKPGDEFDPAVMEAIAEVDPPAGGGPPGTIVDEIEPGYRLHEKVIRPARVRLIKEKS